jgi:hypothetical protein
MNSKPFTLALAIALVSTLLSAAQQRGTPAEEDSNPLDLVVVDALATLFTTRDGDTSSQPWLRPDGTEFKTWQPYFVGRGGHIDRTNEDPDLRVELLDEETKEIIGYVPQKYLLWGRTNGRRQAMRVRRPDDTSTNIFQKALVVTHYRELDKQDEVYEHLGPTVTVVPVRSPGANHRGPENQHLAGQPISLHAHLYVWQIRNIRGDDWYLLARTPYKNEYRNGTQSWIVGWLPKRQIHNWDTAQCLEFDFTTRAAGRTTATAVFDSEEHARQAISPSQAALVPPDSIYSTEDLATSGSWPTYRTRFPLIRVDDRTDPANPMYELGWIGGLYVPNGQPLTPAEAAELQNRLNRTLTGLMQLDLIIVLDGTQSMQRYQTAAINAMNSIVESVRAQAPTGWHGDPSAIRTRCAIAVYRNAADSDSGPHRRFQFLPFKQLELGPERQQVQDYIKAIQFGSDSDEPREAVFEGISRAVAESRLGQTANPNAYKLMIVIGDSGNLSSSPATDSKSVINTLNGADYDFCAISVTDPDEGLVSHHESFRSEMIQIANAMKIPSSFSGAGPTNPTVGRYRPPSRDTPPPFNGRSRLLHLSKDDQLIGTIQEACRLGLESRNKIIAVVENPDIYPNHLQQSVQTFMQKRGVSPAILHANKVQLFGTGYSTEKNARGQSQWKLEQMVDINDLGGLVNGLLVFDQFVGIDLQLTISPEIANGVCDALAQTFRISAGDKTGPTLERLLGDRGRDLPIASPLLKRTIPELAAYLSLPSHQARAEELRRLGVCFRILRHYTLNERFVVTRDEKDMVDGVQHVDGSADYWIKRDEFRFAWIPAEYFP